MKKVMKTLLNCLPALLFLVGIVLVLYGIYRLSLTAACIVAGLVLLYLGFVADQAISETGRDKA